MKRLKLRASVAIGCAMLIMAFTGCEENPGKTMDGPPNLVLILVDDLGYGDLASYGHLTVKTPHIDKLAQRGIKYTQYYAPSPLCSPSRAGLLTGRTPYRTGIRSWIPPGSNIHLGKNEITLAHLLKDKGYETAVMGKLHLNGGAERTDQPQAKDMGFDYSFVIPGGWAKNKKIETKPSDGTLRRGKIYPDNYWRNGVPVGETNKFSGQLVADEVTSWLDKREKGNPFFLYVSFSEVHTPISSPEEYLEMYSNYITDFAKKNPYLYHWDWVNQPYRGQGEYYANISFLDAQVGKVISELKARDELDNSIIIFTSDNGPVTREARKPWELNMAGETGGLRGRKDNLFEGGIRVPAIVSYPSEIEPGQISDAPIYGLDWLPTLAELLNFEVPTDREIDGQSIINTMKGLEIDREKPMIWTIDMEGQDDPINEWAIRADDWLLILDRGEQPKFLFNIANDPYQVVNLINDRNDILLPLLEQFLMYRSNIEADSVNVTTL
ncbi:sulfatase family protein [Neolewinella persica]|uniref:sulfatase family protein n=1 Tax=Neolewinella persica TaxID=70998 RepID=UPI0003AA36F1|nr:sulfatase-like hydrolase/transferase [Neolewinella persica]